MKKSEPLIPLWIVLIPIGFLVVSMFVSIKVLGQSAHLALALSTALAAVIAYVRGMSWHDIHTGIVDGISLAMGAILILMVVGCMIGTWILGGIVPTMIHYGLIIFSPGIFLFITMIICSIVALGTGSSWSTIGTVGVALIGVGQGLGIPLPMVAGAIVSGSYFGDKMSPLSDTTNLAPGIAGTDLFTHIRHMVYTTVPSFIIAGILYIVIGLKFSGNNLDAQQLDQMLSALNSQFVIHPILLLPPLLVILMVIFKIPALPAILAGVIIGGFFAMVTQHQPLSLVTEAAFSGYVSNTGFEAIDKLLSRGGLMGMMETVALIICALAFGGIMEKSGMLHALTSWLLKRVRSNGSLIFVTEITCISSNIMAPDQFLSIVVPGRMYKSAFKERGLAPKNLSRALEDAGTLTSPLIPWNTCGAFIAAALGVSPLLYFSFAFFNLINPLVSLFYGYTGITMTKIKIGVSDEH